MPKNESDKDKVLNCISRCCFALQFAVLIFCLAVGFVLQIRGITLYGILLIAFGCVMFAAFSILELYIEKKTGYSCCEYCGHIYEPDWKNVLGGWHKNNTHLMRCPKCGRKSWHTKVYDIR